MAVAHLGHQRCILVGENCSKIVQKHEIIARSVVLYEGVCHALKVRVGIVFESTSRKNLPFS
jgi:hypothetical protein